MGAGDLGLYFALAFSHFVSFKNVFCIDACKLFMISRFIISIKTFLGNE